MMPDCSTCYSYIGRGFRDGKCDSGFTPDECKGKWWEPYYRCMGGCVFHELPKRTGYVLINFCYDHCMYYSPCPRVGILSGRFKLKDWLPHLTEQDKQFLGIHGDTVSGRR